MEKENLKKHIEALLFSATQLISVQEMRSVFNEDDKPNVQEIKDAINYLKAEYDEKSNSFQILEIANKFRFCIKPDFAGPVKKLLGLNKRDKLTRPALETLAIVAYRQPVIKAEIESIRGVAVDGLLRKLIEKGLVRIAGRSGEFGRAFLYETTEKFMDHFGLKDLNDLPKRKELNPGSINK